MSSTLTENNSDSERDEEESKKSDHMEMPEDLLGFVPSPKKRDVNIFTEEFSFVILPHLGLVIVYITEVGTGQSGYCNDLRQAIRLKNSNQDECPYIAYTAEEKRDPINKLCPGLWGPYSRVNDREEIVTEVPVRMNRKGEQTAYPATCFLLIPKLSGPPRRISVQSVEEQVQSFADYCNKVYLPNQRQYQAYLHTAPRVPQSRSFGLARHANRTNASVHDGLPLNKFISRRHVVDFLVNAYNCDGDFYQNKKSVAMRLLHPPHTLDEKRLGYPCDGF